VTLVKVGIGLTVTVVVYMIDGLHPGLPEPSVTVSEYVDVTVGVAVGFSVVFEESEGPLQA
jgi:hypothetical protein